MSAAFQEIPTGTVQVPQQPDVDVGKAIAEAFGGIGAALLDAMVGGLFRFFGTLGEWLYDLLGPVMRSFNIVTQRPEEWTNKLDLVREVWSHTRWIGTFFLVFLFFAHVYEWQRASERGGTSAGLLADAMAAQISGIIALQFSLSAVDHVMPGINALLAWAATPAGIADPTAALPAWQQMADANPDTPEGIAKLIMSGLIGWSFGHLMVGTAWWDVLLMVMNFAFVAGCWQRTETWFDRWVGAVGASLTAHLLLCLALRLCGEVVARVGRGLERIEALKDVSDAAVYGLLGIGFAALVFKLAKQTHAGIDLLSFPGLGGRRGGGGGGHATRGGTPAAATATQAAGIAAAPATGGASAAAATTYANTAAGAVARAPLPIAP